ncbi:MAG TPA: hypothetical protein VFA07_03430 [Chthonomonadaceae bacterium]|nr:hypothetical protein [Chthonomonadaceae bacterium]
MLLLTTACFAQALENTNIKARWDFKCKDFVIGAWWGPGATDAEMKLYKDAGFNVVMIGRYMQLDDYAHADEAVRELDLAKKYDLGVMFDTYTKNDHPWGGKAGPTDSHPLHHPASLVELQWLYDRFGQHPALIGFLIGDDQGAVSERSAACTRFLYNQPGPRLMPWLCGWIAPENLATHNNPIEDPQIYPTLYQGDLPARTLARQYAAAYAGISRRCRDLGLLFWPMFNTTRPNAELSASSRVKKHQNPPAYLPSDSLIRFPAYAALAYGAEGIWYFTYGGGALERSGPYTTDAEARQALTPLYPVAKRINHRIGLWGPLVMGRASTGLFGTAFDARQVPWPFPEDTAGQLPPEALTPPAPGKLIETMSDDLLVGILTRPGEAPLAMVVDCRASNTFGDLPEREVTLQFAPAVTGIRILEGRRGRSIAGHTVRLTLEAGGGQMLALQGKNLDSLSSEQAIYAPPPVKTPPVGWSGLTPDALAHIRAARLRIDVFGADSAPQYQAKFIDLNGHTLSRIPNNDHDAWNLETVAFAPDQFAWIRKENVLTVRTECGDAWKFRNLTLAVQLADGTWVKSNTDATVHSASEWANSEGQTWSKDGLAGPITLELR